MRGVGRGRSQDLLPSLRPTPPAPSPAGHTAPHRPKSSNRPAGRPPGICRARSCSSPHPQGVPLPRPDAIVFRALFDPATSTGRQLAGIDPLNPPPRSVRREATAVRGHHARSHISAPRRRPPRLERRRDRRDPRPAPARPRRRGQRGASRAPRSLRRAEGQSAVDQDRRLPGGLRLLPAIGAPSRGQARPRRPHGKPTRSWPWPRARNKPGPTASAWARPGAACATAASSMPCSAWSRACAHWAWRPASRSACSLSRRPRG